MDEILLNCYLKYKKEQDELLWKKIIKNGTFRLVAIIMAFIIICAVGAVVISLIESIRIWSWIPLALEVICCVILYILTEQYEIKNSSDNMEKYISNCHKLEAWLQKNQISSDEAIQLLHKRLTDQIDEIKAECKIKRERREKWLQTLMLPVMLSIISVAIANRTNTSEIITVVASITFGFYLIYGVYSINPIFTELLKKRRLERIKYFARDLQDILDLHYYEKCKTK